MKTVSTIDQVQMSARPAGGGVPVVPRPGQWAINLELHMSGYDDDEDDEPTETDLPDEDEDEDGDDADIDVSDFDDDSE
jgi:hypothetical protein